MGPGPSGMVQGVEYGALKRVEFINRTEPLQLNAIPEFVDTIRELNLFADKYSHFHQNGNLHFVDHYHEAILAALRTDPDGNQAPILIMTNVSIHHTQHININLKNLGYDQRTLINLQTGEKLVRQESHWSFEMSPCSYHILSL